MKKIFMIFMGLVLALSFIGCAEEDTNNPSSEDMQALSVGMGAADGAISQAITAKKSSGSYSYNPDSTVSITGTYDLDDITGDGTMTFNIVFDAYTFDYAGETYYLTGTIGYNMITAGTSLTVEYTGNYSFGNNTVNWNMSIAIDSVTYATSISGTFTVNGNTFNADYLSK